MGFGVLFFGYFVMFAFSLSTMYFFADIIGSVITAYAFTKIAQYNRYYNTATVFALLFLLFSAVKAADLMFDIYPDGYISLAVNMLRLVSAAVMHIFMFLGARGIALGAGAAKLPKNAERNMVMTLLYYASYAVITNITINDEVLDAYLNMMLLLYFLVCFILNLVFIYRCYAVLAPADEDITERKPSRFKLINKIDAKMDEIEKSKQEYRKESVRLALEEADRMAREKKKHYKQPKKRKK